MIFSLNKYRTGDGDFITPFDIASDSDRNFYVMDLSNQKVQNLIRMGNYCWKDHLRKTHRWDLCKELQ